jgi:hypothetical protein
MGNQQSAFSYFKNRDRADFFSQAAKGFGVAGPLVAGRIDTGTSLWERVSGKGTTSCDEVQGANDLAVEVYAIVQDRIRRGEL